jgi:uncharacterized protein YjbI with pentapeptide repeats
MDDTEEFLRRRAILEEIIKRYEVGERNFTGIELRNTAIDYTCFMDVDFSRANLHSSGFDNIYLVNTNFSCANLEGTSFSGFLINCNFSNANLREAYLRNLTGVDLTSADLSGADLRRAKLIGTNLRNANLTGIKMTSNTIFCNTTMPDGTISTNSNYVLDAQELLKRYADGERDFRDVILHRVDLSGVNLRSINLCGAYFSHVNLQGATLEGNDLSAHFICCDMRNSQLICPDIDYSGKAPKLICSDLRFAKLWWFEWCGARHIGNNYQGATGIHDGSGEGFAFIHSTTWIGGEFVAGLTWGLQPLNFRDIDLRDF